MVQRIKKFPSSFNSIVHLSAYISSANYPMPYPKSYFGNWNVTVTAPPTAKITFVVTDMAIECDCYHCTTGVCSGTCDVTTCSFCYYDYVKVIIFLASTNSTNSSINSYPGIDIASHFFGLKFVPNTYI